MLPTKFWFVWPSDIREEFLKIDQSETRIARGSHVWMGQNEHLYRGPAIDAFYQVTVHLDKWS